MSPLSVPVEPLDFASVREPVRDLGSSRADGVLDLLVELGLSGRDGGTGVLSSDFALSV